MKKTFHSTVLALFALLWGAIFPFLPRADGTNFIALSGSSQTSAGGGSLWGSRFEPAQTQLVRVSMQHLANRQAKAWENADLETIVADFAEDARFVVPGTSFQGKQEIRAAAKDYFANFANTQITVKRIIENSHDGAVEWSWSDQQRKTGQKNYADDAIILELENGKITYWREYIDSQSPKK